MYYSTFFMIVWMYNDCNDELRIMCIYKMWWKTSCVAWSRERRIHTVAYLLASISTIAKWHWPLTLTLPCPWLTAAVYITKGIILLSKSGSYTLLLTFLNGCDRGCEHTSLFQKWSRLPLYSAQWDLTCTFAANCSTTILPNRMAFSPKCSLATQLHCVWISCANTHLL